MEKETLIAEAKTAIQIALLNEKVMHQVATDKNKNNYAYGIIVAAAILGGLGLKFFSHFFVPSWSYVLSMTVYQAIASVVMIYVLSAVAKNFFKGQAHHDAFFRVMAFGMIVTWLSIFPKLWIVYLVWGCVVAFVALKTIHKLTSGGAAGAIAVSVLAMIVVSMILSSVLGTLGLGNFGYGSYKFMGGNITGISDINN